jgi:hypothetical protein
MKRQVFLDVTLCHWVSSTGCFEGLPCFCDMNYSNDTFQKPCICSSMIVRTSHLTLSQIIQYMVVGPDNFLAQVLNTIYSCDQEGIVTVRLTWEWPAIVTPYSKTFSLLGICS